jgi:susD family
MQTATGYQPIKFVQAPKSPGSNNDNDAISSSTNDMPVYRYAEVLLILAEAKAELGTLTQADLDVTINVLRDRVGMPHLILSQANANPDPYLASAETGFPNVSGSNKGVILEIRRERGIEMVMEGVRLDDLFRWKAGKCLDQAISGMYFPGPGTYDLTGDGKADVGIYEEGKGKPAGVKAAYQINSDIYLSDGTRGYFDWHKGMKSERYGFNENRDYLYPIPQDQLSVNDALVQNPGW